MFKYSLNVNSAPIETKLRYLITKITPKSSFYRQEHKK